MPLQQLLRIRPKPRSMPRLQRHRALPPIPQRPKELRRRTILEPQARGSCASTTPSFFPNPAVSAKKPSRAAAGTASFASCVTVFGNFTENRKSSGTASAHFTHVAGRCARWKLELISTQFITRAYRSR